MIISCHLRNKTSLPRLSPTCSQAPPLRRSDVPPSAAPRPSARAQHIPCGRGDPLRVAIKWGNPGDGAQCPTMTNNLANNLAKELQS